MAQVGEFDFCEGRRTWRHSRLLLLAAISGAFQQALHGGHRHLQEPSNSNRRDRAGAGGGVSPAPAEVEISSACFRDRNGLGYSAAWVVIHSGVSSRIGLCI